MSDFDDEKQKKQLEDLRRQEEEELIASLSESEFGIPYIDLYHQIVENEALRIIPEEEARSLKIAPFRISGKNALIAVRSPQPELLEKIKEEVATKGYAASFYMASEASLRKVWDRYVELSMAETSRVGGVEISATVLRGIAENISGMKDIGRVIDEAVGSKESHKISRILEVILAGAIALKASDVHVEPEKESARVRLRLDGVLYDVAHLPLDVYHLLNSRVKLLSGMKLTGKISQDGRFSIIEGKDEINIRSSMIPGSYGEAIVMRILDPKSIQVPFEELGIPRSLLQIVEEEIKKPNGMILLTGPTGSGKTTTLYAILKKIYSPEINIITIEDPVEYHIPGITQTQVAQVQITEDKRAAHLKTYNFLEGLRSALRQDPDVIMIGEIRDSETAKTAVQSALTGHLVLSTLHTNNAAGVIPRLIDLEVNPKIMASALTLSMAQRLVRRLCQFCKVEKSADPETEETINNTLENMERVGKNPKEYGVAKREANLKIFFPVGCNRCNETGYSGRIGVFEAIKTNATIEKIIPENPSEREIKMAAENQKILTMREDGIVKVLTGVTSVAELSNVVDLSSE